MVNAIEISNLGKMYKLYSNLNEKVLDIFRLSKYRFWKPEVDYTEFWALRSINLIVEKGQRLGIIGKNGAGKSTLLKIVSGNILPTEGNAKVNGKIQALMQLGVGFHPEFTGRENIRASLSYNGMSRSRIISLEEEIIDFSELEDFIDQPVKAYSSGMYSRLAFAVSTVLEPDIMIIDEILGAGDAAFTSKCADRMKKLTKDAGSTVLFVSHSMDSVLEMCESAILLEKGQVTASGDVLAVSKIYNKQIRMEEELYLKAKEYKVKKTDVRVMETVDPLNNILLFRFRSSGPHPEKKHKIYKCSIFADNIPVAILDVGNAMDNDLNSLTRIIDGKRFMDWGKPDKDTNGYYRTYSNEGGINNHAPFQFAVPKHLYEKELVLIIEAALAGEEIYIDLWDGKNYRNIGAFPKGQNTATEYSFVIGGNWGFEEWIIDPNESSDGSEYRKNDDFNEVAEYNNFGEPANESEQRNNDEASMVQDIDIEDNHYGNEEENKYAYYELKKENSIYGSEEIIIESVDIIDSKEISKRVFTVGEKLSFRLSIHAKTRIEKYAIVLAILTTTGRAVSQVFCHSEDLDISGFGSIEEVDISFNPLRIGAGDYMASIGLYKSYDLSSEAENEAYCVIDRAVFFNVKQPDTMRKIIGINAHDCVFTSKEKQYEYNPANHYLV